MTRPIDRRTFLALGIGAVAWACGRGQDQRAGDDRPRRTRDPESEISVLAGAPVLAVGDTRQAFVVLRGQRPFVPEDLEVRLVPPGGRPVDVETQHEKIHRHLGGEDHEHSGTEAEDIFVVRHDFKTAGPWDLDVSFDGGSGAASFQVREDVPSPKVGDKAIASKSPTTADEGGVDPICTRDPVCSMHDVTIEDALRAGKPLVVTFATPRFCTSRACGPVVDLLEEQKKRVAQRASFVHVEVWKDDEGAVNQQPSPTFAQWKFDGEPWTYFIDADGRVKDRWLGPVGADELEREVDSLIAG